MLPLHSEAVAGRARTVQGPNTGGQAGVVQGGGGWKGPWETPGSTVSRHGHGLRAGQPQGQRKAPRPSPPCESASGPLLEGVVSSLPRQKPHDSTGHRAEAGLLRARGRPEAPVLQGGSARCPCKQKTTLCKRRGITWDPTEGRPGNRLLNRARQSWRHLCRRAEPNPQEVWWLGFPARIGPQRGQRRGKLSGGRMRSGAGTRGRTV